MALWRVEKFVASTNQFDDGNRHEKQMNKREKSVKHMAISEENVDKGICTTIVWTYNYIKLSCDGIK